MDTVGIGLMVGMVLGALAGLGVGWALSRQPQRDNYEDGYRQAAHDGFRRDGLRLVELRAAHAQARELAAQLAQAQAELDSLRTRPVAPPAHIAAALEREIKAVLGDQHA